MSAAQRAILGISQVVDSNADWTGILDSISLQTTSKEKSTKKSSTHSSSSVSTPYSASSALSSSINSYFQGQVIGNSLLSFVGKLDSQKKRPPKSVADFSSLTGTFAYFDNLWSVKGSDGIPGKISFFSTLLGFLESLSGSSVSFTTTTNDGVDPNFSVKQASLGRPQDLHTIVVFLISLFDAHFHKVKKTKNMSYFFVQCFPSLEEWVYAQDCLFSVFVKGIGSKIVGESRHAIFAVLVKLVIQVSKQHVQHQIQQAAVASGKGGDGKSGVQEPSTSAIPVPSFFSGPNSLTQSITNSPTWFTDGKITLLLRMLTWVLLEFHGKGIGNHGDLPELELFSDYPNVSGSILGSMTKDGIIRTLSPFLECGNMHVILWTSLFLKSLVIVQPLKLLPMILMLTTVMTKKIDAGEKGEKAVGAAYALAGLVSTCVVGAVPPPSPPPAWSTYGSNSAGNSTGFSENKEIPLGLYSPFISGGGEIGNTPSSPLTTNTIMDLPFSSRWITGTLFQPTDTSASSSASSALPSPSPSSPSFSLYGCPSLPLHVCDQVFDVATKLICLPSSTLKNKTHPKKLQKKKFGFYLLTFFL